MQTESARDLKGSTHLFEHGAAKKLQRYIANHTPKDSKSTFAPKIMPTGQDNRASVGAFPFHSPANVSRLTVVPGSTRRRI